MMEVLRAALPHASVEDIPSNDQPTIGVAASQLVEVCRTLRDAPGLQYILLADITAVDWWPREPRYEVVYHLSSLTHRLRVKVRIEGSSARLPTVQSVWPGAGWPRGYDSVIRLAGSWPFGSGLNFSFGLIP